MEKQNEFIGALWNKQSAKGFSYMSGLIEIDGKKISIVLFKTREKKSDKSPDWNILLSKPMQKQEEKEEEKEISIDDLNF
jgi:uncharacterized protein (DUF736 family)